MEREKEDGEWKMLLVEGPEYECQDSPGVSACPCCGSPVKVRYIPKTETVQSIEISERRRKWIKAGSIAAFILGLVLWVGGPESAAGPLIALGGLLINLYASIDAWWEFD
jgi:hypothetical protein